MRAFLAAVLVAGCVLAGVAAAEDAPAVAGTPPAAVAAMDVGAATDAYLARLGGAERARSDAYFEGGYWLQLWSFLWGAAVSLGLLASGLSRRMRDLAERVASRPSLSTGLYWLQYLVVQTVLTFPLGLYAGYLREHAYGLSTQTLAAWLGDEAKGLALGAVLGGALVIAVYAVVRRASRTWWLWGAGVTMAFTVFAIAISPVFVAPLFNDYTPLADEEIRGPILSMARANGVPAGDVWVFDASRQHNRVSANVSGFLGTQRISLNDNLLNRCTPAEIQAVMAHELGHYVLNHVPKLLVAIALLVVAGFAFLRFGFDRMVARWGGRWGVRGVADPAGLPLAMLLLSVFFFAATPITNTIVRVQEAEADLFGLNAAREPDAFAEVALKLADYRKLSPSPLEEWLLFDHPSGRTRIFTAMRWKAEQGR